MEDEKDGVDFIVFVVPLLLCVVRNTVSHTFRHVFKNKHNLLSAQREKKDQVKDLFFFPLLLPSSSPISCLRSVCPFRDTLDTQQDGRKAVFFFCDNYFKNKNGENGEGRGKRERGGGKRERKRREKKQKETTRYKK